MTKNKYRCAHFNTKQVFSHCTKEYVHINIYFWNNQMDASVFYTQLTCCTSCNYDFLGFQSVLIFFQMWSCGWGWVLFSTRLQPRSSLSILYHNHSCLPHQLLHLWIASSTSAKLFPRSVVCHVLIVTVSPGSSAVFARETHSTWIQVAGMEGRVLTSPFPVFSHGPELDHKAVVAPDLIFWLIKL